MTTRLLFILYGEAVALAACSRWYCRPPRDVIAASMLGFFSMASFVTGCVVLLAR